MGWWVIKDEHLMDMLKEVQAGAPPGVVFLEHYANSEVAHPDE